MGHSPTPRQNTADDGFPADPIDGYVHAALKTTLALSATKDDDHMHVYSLAVGPRTYVHAAVRVEVGATVASDWATDLDRYGDPVLPWSRAHNLLASGPKGLRSTHRFMTYSGCQPVSVWGMLGLGVPASRQGL